MREYTREFPLGTTQGLHRIHAQDWGRLVQALFDPEEPQRPKEPKEPKDFLFEVSSELWS